MYLFKLCVNTSYPHIKPPCFYTHYNRYKVTEVSFVNRIFKENDSFCQCSETKTRTICRTVSGFTM